jgi:uncharacterized damage-inducible protein DinB
MMEHNLHNTIVFLSHFPAALDGLLRYLPEQCAVQNEGENTWSAFDVVRHLVHVERTDWMPRIRTVLQYGETQTFEPLDREAHMRESRNKPLADILDEFTQARAQSMAELHGLDLQQKELDLAGRHPALGLVTVSQLLAAWAVHDLTHLHQITRILARQYGGAVGPFREYLGVLQCSGRGSR